MNRRVMFILLLLFLFPAFVEAKSCTVVSGTGNDIGDEVSCGSEHFYILEKDNDTVKMLSKYNLYVGDKIEKDSMMFDEKTYGDIVAVLDAVDERCDFLRATYGDDNVERTGKYTEDGEPVEFFCRIYIPLEYDSVKQSELAIGLFPNKNKEMLYPIYGSIDLDEEVGNKEFDENFDMIPESSEFYSYLEEYTKTLTNIGVNVLDIGFIKKSGIESLINSVSNKKIKIPTYSPGDEEIDPEDNIWEPIFYWDYEKPVYKFNIQEYVPEKYAWLYGTTYWVGSATKSVYEDYFDEFLSTVGDYCSYVRGCTISRMGVGLRPVVSINSSEISLPVNYDYIFIKGDNQKFMINDIKEYTFTIDGDYSLFDSLKIGGLDLINNEDYIVTEGSTIITFTENGLAKLNTLSKGEYEIIVIYSNDKKVKGKLIIDQEDIKNNEIDDPENEIDNPENRINNPENEIDNPKTGDKVCLYLGVCLISMSGLGIYLYNSSRKRFN